MGEGLDPAAVKLMLKAAKHGDCAALKSLLAEQPGLLDARDSDASTPLHCACWKGNLDAARVLLEAGADVNAVNANDHWGTTPLHAAAHANQRDIVALLLEQGANREARDGSGRTPLEHTEIHRATAAAKVLRG